MLTAKVEVENLSEAILSPVTCLSAFAVGMLRDVCYKGSELRQPQLAL